MEHPRRQYPRETAELQRIAQGCGLLEEIKWGKPCFTFEGKNVILIQRFNDYIALLVFKGALLKDSEKLLSRVGEHMQAPRQLRFSSLADITRLRSTIKAYIKQAIGVESRTPNVPQSPSLQANKTFTGKAREAPVFAPPPYARKVPPANFNQKTTAM